MDFLEFRCITAGSF